MVTERLSDEDAGLPADAGLLARDKFPVWEACGADGKVLAEISSSTAGPLLEPDARSGWASRLMALGNEFCQKARSPAVDDRKKSDLYSKAAMYYGLSRFPATETPLKREAYARQISMLTEASRHYPFVFRREMIPYGGKDIIVNFYEPRPEKEITMPEAVLLTGDIDCTKEDLHTICMKIVGDGMVCMAIDMPGTGESAWKLEPPDGNEVYSRAIKYLAGRWAGDPSRLGMIGIGFGGYWSLAAASTCPEIKAVVNCGAPVHRAFAQENVKQWPGYLKVALSKALGYDLKDFDKAYGLLGEFSLSSGATLVSTFSPRMESW